MRSNGSFAWARSAWADGFDPSVGWESILDRQLRSRMTTRPFQFAGAEDNDRPKCELLERCQRSEVQPSPKSRPPNSEQLRSVSWMDAQEFRC